MSRIDTPSIIVLEDGREITCPRVKEVERGWECWRLPTEAEDKKNEGPLNPESWYSKNIVVEVRNVASDSSEGR